MKLLNRTTLIVCINLLITAATLWAYHQWQKPRIGWVNITLLYNDFGLKKDMEKKLEQEKAVFQHKLDSVREQATAEAAGGNAKAYARQSEVWQNLKQYYDADISNRRTEYQTQIFNQLNQYVKDYALANNYRIILGANGEGSLMYADEQMDITEKIKAYANQRYSGTPSAH